jgi:hypothetical protein
MSRIGIMLACLVGLGAAPFLFAALQNNHRLNRLEDRFLSLKHPLRSETVHRFSKVGRLYQGKGSACSYVVGEVRSATGDLGDALVAYAGLTIEGAEQSPRGGSRQCAVTAQPLGENFEENGAAAYGFHDAAIMKEVGALGRSRRDLYLVVCADTGYPAGFDLRCR